MVNSISITSQNVQPNMNSNHTNKVAQQAIIDDTPILAEAAQSHLLSGVAIEETELPAEKAKIMTESINEILNTTSTKLRYQYHEKLDKYYVTLVNSETDEVVREVPNKKLMDIYAAMLNFVGVLVDEKI